MYQCWNNLQFDNKISFIFKMAITDTQEPYINYRLSIVAFICRNIATSRTRSLSLYRHLIKFQKYFDYMKMPYATCLQQTKP